ncbi:hypothetical protein BGZ52_012925 [Haplosporangium bisporale]|nr:hypothetical protein BGZ52_012925 [Haplosporangium bisporale]
MRFSVIVIAATLLSACTVMAQQAYPTAPISTTKWNAGTEVTIKWKLNAPATKTPLTVDLLTGTSAASQHIVKTLGTGAAGGTSIKVLLPADLASGWYSIRIGDSYSAFFTIVGKGPVPTAPAPPSVNATATFLPTTALPNVTLTTSVLPTTSSAAVIAPSPAPASGASTLSRASAAAVVVAVVVAAALAY